MSKHNLVINELVLLSDGKSHVGFLLTQTLASSNNTEQDAQLSQRDRAAGCVIVFAKSRRLELGGNFMNNSWKIRCSLCLFSVKML